MWQVNVPFKTPHLEFGVKAVDGPVIYLKKGGAEPKVDPASFYSLIKVYVSLRALSQASASALLGSSAPSGVAHPASWMTLWRR